jgi:hypothetical protein
MVPREVVMGLDPLERGISLFGAGIALVLALVTAIEWSRNLPTITTQKHVKGKACPSAYPKLVNTLCEHIVKTTRSEWEVKFFFILVVALCLLYFSLRRKRAGVACFAIFLGLGLGLGAGAVFFFLGAWLIIRAYRLQKYGVAGMVASNQVAREMSLARREGREPNLELPSSSAPPRSPSRGSTKNSTQGPKGPDASKRYTPKKRAPKRR